MSWRWLLIALAYILAAPVLLAIWLWRLYAKDLPYLDAVRRGELTCPACGPFPLNGYFQCSCGWVGPTTAALCPGCRTKFPVTACPTCGWVLKIR
ncbi:MAG: hypothetical protein WC538_03810 [Thermoanaerobaculia bacterium]|jgi:hypothetical protein